MMIAASRIATALERRTRRARAATPARRRTLRVHRRRATHAGHRSGWDRSGRRRIHPNRARCRRFARCARRMAAGASPVTARDKSAWLVRVRRYSERVDQALRRCHRRGFHVSCASPSAPRRGWRRALENVSAPLSPGASAEGPGNEAVAEFARLAPEHRIRAALEALEQNGISTHFVDAEEQARAIVRSVLPPPLCRSVEW